MSARRQLTAFLTWWVEPAPRWAMVVGAPVVVVLLSLVGWQLVGGERTPGWVPDATAAVAVGAAVPVVLGGWIHAYARVYRRTGSSDR